MSDERLERLTELARKAWPELVRLRVGHLPPELWQLQVETRDFHSTVIRLNHVKETLALDAFEAALRVLAGEPRATNTLRTVDAIRQDWACPTHCLRESDEADVHALLAALDAQSEKLAITHACWVADRNRAEAAERGLAELRAFATYHARVYGLHGLALKQLQEAVAGTSPLLAEIAALPKEATP